MFNMDVAVEEIRSKFHLKECFKKNRSLLRNLLEKATSKPTYALLFRRKTEQEITNDKNLTRKISFQKKSQMIKYLPEREWEKQNYAIIRREECILPKIE